MAKPMRPLELLSTADKIEAVRLIPIRKLLNEDQIVELARKGLSMTQISALFGRSPNYIRDNYEQTWRMGRALAMEQVMTAVAEKAFDDGDLRALDILRKELTDKEEPATVNINVNTQLPTRLTTVDVEDLNDL